MLYLCSTKKGAKLLTLNGTNVKAPRSFHNEQRGKLSNQRKGMETIQTYQTTYAVAASWAGCTTILCNNVAEIDEDLFCDTIGYEYDEEADIYDIKVKGDDEKEYILSWGNRSDEWQRVTYVTLAERRAYETGEEIDITSELAQVITDAIRSSK